MNKKIYMSPLQSEYQIKSLLKLEYDVDTFYKLEDLYTLNEIKKDILTDTLGNLKEMNNIEEHKIYYCSTKKENKLEDVIKLLNYNVVVISKSKYEKYRKFYLGDLRKTINKTIEFQSVLPQSKLLLKKEKHNFYINDINKSGYIKLTMDKDKALSLCEILLIIENYSDFVSLKTYSDNSLEKITLIDEYSNFYKKISKNKKQDTLKILISY